MRIVYFYQYFSTPNGSWGTRVYEFGKEWVEKGHEVIVVTGIYSKSDLTAEKLVETQMCEGIELKIINVRFDNKQSFLARILSFIQYSLISSWYALTLKADIVIASSGPITVGIPGLLAKYIRGRKLVFEVRDLWPQGAIELGIIKNKWLNRLACWFEKKCYSASSYIVTLSPGMTKNIQDRFDIQHITDVTNAANIEMFGKKQPYNDSKLPPQSYAIYTGNIGMVNNSYWLYNAAKRLKEFGREDIKIVLIGDGQQKNELNELARKENTNTFLIMDLMPKEQLVPYVQHALVSLVPLKGTPILDTSSPNKFFESLAAGVPVIQNTNGWMKDFLNKTKTGITVDPNNPEQLAEALIRFKDNPELVDKMKVQALSIAREKFDKNYLANKMLKILTSVHES